MLNVLKTVGYVAAGTLVVASTAILLIPALLASLVTNRVSVSVSLRSVKLYVLNSNGNTVAGIGYGA